jgi:quaternary ammonium compound-resistance protein SugE
MAWWYLLAAGVAEIVMALALKASADWTRAGPSVLGVAAALLSIFLLTQALRGLPLGTAYALWTGIGAVGVAAAGVLFFDEALSAQRVLCMLLVVAGSIGLRSQAGA